MARTMNMNNKSVVLFSGVVKLAIWEASLDNFVESIQSIPEVFAILFLSI